jgi:hypothetical protein
MTSEATVRRTDQKGRWAVVADADVGHRCKLTAQARCGRIPPYAVRRCEADEQVTSAGDAGYAPSDEGGESEL